MSNNRRRGHNFEREIAVLFRGLGYENARTSRQSSKLLDDSGVDIDRIPFNVQCKEGIQKGIVYSNVLTNMRVKLKENFPERVDLLKLVIHKKPPFGKKREPEDTLVIMSLYDFVTLIENKQNENKS